MAQNSWQRMAAGVGLAVALASCVSVSPPDPRAVLPPITGADPQAQSGTTDLPAGKKRQAQIVPGQGAVVAEPHVAQVVGSGYMVNLFDADLNEATRVILGDLLGASFSIDPGVQGKITISGTASLSRADLLALFEQALRQNGAALVRQGEAFRVSTLADAQGSGRLLGSGEPGFGVTAVPLKFLGADAARTLLEGTLLKTGQVRTDPGRNVILVSGTRGERASAVETLSSFDVDWIAAMSVGIFPVENADPQTVIAELEQIFQTTQGGPGAGTLRLRPLNRLNSILAIGASPELLSRVNEWVSRLDVETGDTTVLRSYFLDSGKAEETARLLSDLFSGTGSGGGPIASPGDTSVIGSTGAQTGLAPKPFTPAAPSSPSAPGQPRIIADKLNNALLVLADPAGHKLVQRALIDIDREPSQVMVDATIVEVTLTDRLRYGVQWFFETNGIRGVANSGRGGLSRGNSLDADGVFPGFNFILESGDAARVAIDALSAITNVTVRSSPSLMVMDNQSATLKVGDTVPVITRQASNVVDSNAPIVNQIEFKDTGVTLVVTPRVSSTGIVTLEIDQNVSAVSTTADTGTLTPTISQRSIKSTVAVRSGQTLALGGLIDETRGKTKTGLPLLSQIPVLGALFGSTDANARRTELIVFLTPKVVRNEADVSRTANELQDRMDNITRENERLRGRRPQ